MWIFILTALLFLLVFLFAKLYWLPKRLHAHYVAAFTKAGYRVLEVPFHPLRLISPHSKDYKLSKDPLEGYKKHYCQYDVVVHNMLHQVHFDLLHPDLLQDFLSVEKLSYYTKTVETKDLFKKVGGQGLIFSEGEEWKMKRKVLTEVFNFDFLKQLAPQIAEMADRAYDKMEGSSEGEIRYDVLDATIELAANVMIEGFFGQNIKEDRIEDKKVFTYLKELLGQLLSQRRTILYLMLGPKFLELGIR